MVANSKYAEKIKKIDYLLKSGVIKDEIKVRNLEELKRNYSDIIWMQNQMEQGGKK